VAALLFAAAAVLQQRAAADVPAAEALGGGLVRRLVRRPMWLLGVGADAGAYGIQAVALGLGSLVLVQPLLVTSLLFALPLSAIWAGRRLRRADWIWAGVLTLGLAIFVVVGDPTEGAETAPVSRWLVAAAIVVPAVVVCVLWASRSHGVRRAVLLAVAAGVLYGVTAALTKSAVELLGDGVVNFLTSWEPYALAVAAVLGTYLAQAAFQAGRLEASLPALTVLEPVVAVALGITLLDEEVHAGGWKWLIIGVAAGGMLAASIALPRAAAAAEPEAAIA
jgi:drug/metabolite transporter (DMT)-like permease